MDKYEFNIKVDQMKKLIGKGDYETAMKIADTIDWNRVRSTSLLTLVSSVYERNEEYQEAKDILLLAFERAPIGKSLLFKLTDLALREGNIQEAESYYREFCELSGDDPRGHLLRFLILKEKNAPLEQLANSLERYCHDELDEKWMYYLAELYKEMGREEDCVRLCDKIMLMFGLGKYVDKAMELKLEFAPLSSYQMDLVENREKYEERLREVEEGYQKAPKLSDREEDAVILHEAEVEEDLAREVSGITPFEIGEENDEMGETRIFKNVKDLAKDEPEEEAVEKEELEEAPVSEEELVEETFEEEVKEEAAAEEVELEDWDLEEDETEAEEEAEPEVTNHLMIEAEDAAAGLQLALDSLRKIHAELGTKNPVAKISAEKLNQKGIDAVKERLAGKDLVVERAADLGVSLVDELIELMEADTTGMLVVLIDTPERMEKLHNHYPKLAGKFQCIGCGPKKDELEEKARQEEEELKRRLAEREEAIRRQAAKDAAEAKRLKEIQEEEKRRQQEYAKEDARRQQTYETGGDYETEEAAPAEKAKNSDTMDVEEFVQFACKYAESIDCSISGKSMLALYERAEMMEEDEEVLNKESATELIESAADKAEKKSFGSMFSSKYDKNGLLILKEKHFFD